MAKQVVPGDVICALGVCAKISMVIYCEIYEGRSRYADVEFIDSYGNYRHYKSYYDKGKIIFQDGTVLNY
jgi:hypothetical protein